MPAIARKGIRMSGPIEEVVNVTPAEQGQGNGPDAAPEQGPAAEPHNGPLPEGRGWHAEAGRKGAHRVHQLIQEGKLYEQEHGLKSGRQRLRQLIELGKLYEREHGLTQERRRARGGRPKRLSSEQQLLGFLQSVLRLAKPRFRSQVARLIQLLESEKTN